MSAVRNLIMEQGLSWVVLCFQLSLAVKEWLEFSRHQSQNLLFGAGFKKYDHEVISGLCGNYFDAVEKNLFLVVCYFLF
ncbi:hypothetical protein SLE2022_275660 [Rubroshorea leprosula]